MSARANMSNDNIDASTIANVVNGVTLGLQSPSSSGVAPMRTHGNRLV